MAPLIGGIALAGFAGFSLSNLTGDSKEPTKTEEKPA